MNDMTEKAPVREAAGETADGARRNARADGVRAAGSVPASPHAEAERGTAGGMRRSIIKMPDNFTDVFLHTASKVLVFLILTYAIYILFAGHNNPGGGFVGGLVTASGMVLLYLAFDAKTVRQIIPANFRFIGAAGVLLAVLTGAVPAIAGEPFLTHRMAHAAVPLFGDVHLATAVLFDIGVFLAVIGTAMTIISNISEDE